ncbi:hypothetical protein N0V86_002461 [Didymella sp. IMI 355093]|nr:hypothetical protein N0V86_002461 [Didymella sp. IMI 355093]
MAKRKVKHGRDFTRLEEQKLPDSGYGSDDTQPPTSKRLASIITTIEKTASDGLEPPAAPKFAVKVMSGQTVLVTSKRVKTNQKHKSPSLNHGKHRVAAKPNCHFNRHLLIPVHNEILCEYTTFCNSSRAGVLEGVQRLRKAYSKHTKYTDQLLTEHVSELRYKVTTNEEDNAAFAEIIAVLEERNVVHAAENTDAYDTGP